MERCAEDRGDEPAPEVMSGNAENREFMELFSFLSQHHWVHDLHLTKFLESRVWDHMPPEWIRAQSSMSVEDLNNLPFQSTADLPTEAKTYHHHDDSLTTFLHNASHFSRHRQQVSSALPPPTQVSSDLRKGMSPKKLHEVERMASLVHQVVVESGCNVVVDVGSGLGYLGQVLHKMYGLSVIGLESSEGHSDGAEKRAAKQGLQCSGIRSVPFLITQDQDSVQEFSNLIHDIAATIQPCQHTSAASSLPHHQPSSSQPCQHCSVRLSHCPTSSSQRTSAASSLSHHRTSSSQLCQHCSEESPGHTVSPKTLCSSSCVSRASGNTVDSLRPCQANDVSTIHLEQEALGPAGGCDQSLHTDRDRETGLYVCQGGESIGLHHEGHYLKRGTSTVSECHQVISKDSQHPPCTEMFAEVSPQSVQETVGACDCNVPETDVLLCSPGSPHPVQESDGATPLKPVKGGLSKEPLGIIFSQSVIAEPLDPNELDHSEPVKVVPVSVNPPSFVLSDPHLSEIKFSSELTDSKHSKDSVTEERRNSVTEERWVNCCGHETMKCVKEFQSQGGEELRVCLIGLHCCGDLTPAMLRLYRDVPFLRALCCVSCCYHKMQLLHGSEHFINFPMSAAANTAYAEVCARRQSSLSASASPLSSSSALSATSSASSSSSSSSKTTGVFLTPCSLRLAAQETRVRWAAQTEEDHSHHTRHVAYRAVLELFFRDTSQVPPDRKSMRKLDYRTFDHFVQSYLTAVHIKEDEQAQAACSRLNMLYDEYRQHFQHIEPYTCLQVIMQPVLEWAVLQDRQQWLTEEGLTSDLLPIFDERLSPRNLALVSTKN